jgi:hypothetical protein
LASDARIAIDIGTDLPDAKESQRKYLHDISGDLASGFGDISPGLRD